MPGRVRRFSSATTAGISEVRFAGGEGNTCSTQVTNALSSVPVPCAATHAPISEEACAFWAATSVAVPVTWPAGNSGGGGFAAMRSLAERLLVGAPVTLDH